MTEFSDQEVVAFVDRQMDDKARAAFEAQLRTDGALAHRVAAHGWIARQIVTACGSPPEVAADSAQLERLGLGPGNTGPIWLPVLSRQTGWARWAAGITAIAASLAIGLRRPWHRGGDHAAKRMATGRLAARCCDCRSGILDTVEPSPPVASSFSEPRPTGTGLGWHGQSSRYEAGVVIRWLAQPSYSGWAGSGHCQGRAKPSIRSQ